MKGFYTFEFWFDENDFFGSNTGWKGLLIAEDIPYDLEASTRSGVIRAAADLMDAIARSNLDEIRSSAHPLR